MYAICGKTFLHSKLHRLTDRDEYIDRLIEKYKERKLHKYVDRYRDKLIN